MPESSSAPSRGRAAFGLRASRVAPLILIAVAALSAAPSPLYAADAKADEAPAFTPTAAMDLSALEELVSRRAPSLEQAALDVDLARADVRQSRLLLNPSLDASWGTIPVGETNPPGLRSPMANIPNYGLGVGYTFEIGKRGPRIDRALALERAAKESLRASARAQAIELARLLGVLATSTLRLAGVRGIVESGKKAIALAEERLASSFGTPLDIDRLRIEVARNEQQVLSAESDRAEALAACSALVGAPCRSFTSEAEAKGFLATIIDRVAAPLGPPEDRPDVRALAAAKSAADAELSLARAQAIPDPTVHVGFTHDTFLTSGAQGNSLNLSVSLPIPIFDHGQALADAAQAKRDRAAAQRAKLLEASRARLPALSDRLAAQRARKDALSSSVIPRALAVLRDVEAAAANRLLSLADVIQARRAVAELLVEEADSYADAFDAALEIAAERPTTSEPSQPKPAEHP